MMSFSNIKNESQPGLDAPFHILLVEDDEVDAEAILRTLAQMPFPFTCTVVPDGIEALTFLRNSGAQTRTMQPHMILLDINLPRMSGIEFLRAVRNDETLKRSIIFVLTTSNQEEDRIAAYNQNVAGYLLKSKIGEGFSNLLLLLRFYRQTIEFPPLTTYY